MTITRAEYMRRTARDTPAPVLAHRGTVVGDVFNPTVVPAPCGGPVLDDTLLMVRLRAAAVDESMRLRAALDALEAS